jgi:hypothetical protein
VSQDRVTYSCGFKASKDYNSTRVDLSYETAVREGESAEDALRRARTFVHRELDRSREVEATAPRVDQVERFDASNPDHMRQLRFLQSDLRTKAAQDYVRDRVVGVALADLAKAAAAAREAFFSAKSGRRAGGGQPRGWSDA